jgi:predicted nucleic acid-binding protein
LISASKLRHNYCFSYWDSLIVASALKAKVAILYSEDMQNELIVDKSLKIINPF